MSYWKEKWERQYTPVFDRSTVVYYKARSMLFKNVLEQLGYDPEEVVETQGECLEHNIGWEKVNFSNTEYLTVDCKRVGEITLV